MRIGEKIRALRKERDISQEVLAQALGVTFQAVSKWETGTTLPDLPMVPAIAGFFGVSTDELLSFNIMEQERQVEEICLEAYKYRFSDTAKSEEILKEGLKRFPGNEVILNNLLVVYTVQERDEDIVSLCRSILEIARLDEVRFDVIRILAETYHRMGRQELVAPTLEKLPEIYFTLLEEKAMLLTGEEALKAARSQAGLSRDSLILMAAAECRALGEMGEDTTAAKENFKRLTDFFGSLPGFLGLDDVGRKWIDEEVLPLVK